MQVVIIKKQMFTLAQIAKPNIFLFIAILVFKSFDP